MADVKNTKCEKSVTPLPVRESSSGVADLSNGVADLPTSGKITEQVSQKSVMDPLPVILLKQHCSMSNYILGKKHSLCQLRVTY